MIESATFWVDDSDVTSLHNILLHLGSIGYCETLIRERLGLSDLTELLWRALPIYREGRLAVRDKLNIAIDLFLLQGAIPITEIDQLFNKSEQKALLDSGLILIHGEECFARASLYPVGNALVFSDHAWPKLPHPGFNNIPYDQLMSVGIDSRWLARGTVRRPIGSALDLCTGSGVHALLASSHSRRVVAVDINPRASKCTYFNSQASGAPNIEVSVGDLFEPVQGQHFDLITANPPFVPSPVNSIGYRDGGNSGEDVLRRIVAGIPNHLNPGGTAQIITDMGESEYNPISERLRVWLDGAPMDIIILRLREHSATSFAIGHADIDDDYASFLNSVKDWAGNLKSQGYSQIVSVLITFQWSDHESGSPWTREQKSQPIHSDAGKEIEAMFYAERLVRKQNLKELFDHSNIRRSGPIGLLDARVLGNELHTSTEARVLGKVLPISKWLSSVEKQVLQLLEKPMVLSELLLLTQKLNLPDDTVLTAVISLVRSGFIILD